MNYVVNACLNDDAQRKSVADKNENVQLECIKCFESEHNHPMIFIRRRE